MLRNFSFKRYFLSWMIILSVICLFFILGSEKIFASIDGAVNCHLWEVSEIDENGNMELTNYNSKGTYLKSIVVPNAADFKKSHPTKYANLKKVYVKYKYDDCYNSCIYKSSVYASQQNGTFKISQTKGSNTDEEKVFVGDPIQSATCSLRQMFGMTSQNRIKFINLSNLDVSNVDNMSYMFFGLNNFETINLNSWNTTNVVNMGRMFADSSKLKDLDLGESFVTSKVANMQQMFYGCSSLENLNLNNWDTSNVGNKYKNKNNVELTGDMREMFYGCSSLKTLDLNNWNTANVPDMSSMFENCTSLKKLNVSNWNITNTNMSLMFYNCPNLRYLDLNGWNLNESNQSLSQLFYVEEKTPLLIRTRDNVLKNYNYNGDNRTFFTTTLKVDGDFAKFKIDSDEENVSYSDDKKEKYIIIYPTYTTTDFEEEIINKLKNSLIEERDKIEFKNGEKIDWVPEENYQDVDDALGGTYMIGAEKYSATLKVDGKIAKFKDGNNNLEVPNYNEDRTEKYINIYLMPTASDDKKIVWTKLKKVLEDEKENIEIDKNYAFVKWSPDIDEKQELNQSLGTYLVQTKGYLIENENFSWPQLKSSLNVGDSISIKDLFSIADSPNIPEGCKLIYKIGSEENSYWVEYLPNDILVFDKAGEYPIYLKIDGGENYFDKEYEKNNSKYMTLKIIGEEEKKESDTQTEGTGWFYWETISDGKKTLKDIGLPDRLKTAKYLEGYSDGTIKPNNNITRGEFANMIYKLMCDEKEKVNTDVLKNLNDVKSSDWYGTSVAYVLDKKIFDTGKNFRPNENVTRGEVAEVVYNVIKFYDAAKTKEYELGKHYYNFTDLSGSVSDIVKQLASHGIINGYEDKTFRQNNNITRAEVTKIIFMAFDRKNNSGQKKYSDLDKNHWAYKFLMDASE